MELVEHVSCSMQYSIPRQSTVFSFYSITFRSCKRKRIFLGQLNPPSGGASAVLRPYFGRTQEGELENRIYMGETSPDLRSQLQAH